MDLPTYTNIWRIEKKIYRLYDLNLPVPISMRIFGIAFGVSLVWIGLLNLVGLPFGGGWYLVAWVMPPAAITWACARPVVEHKTMQQLAVSYARWLYHPRVYVRGRRYRSPARARLLAQVWSRTGALADPAPTPAAHTSAPPLSARAGGRSPGPVRAESVLPAETLPQHQNPAPKPTPRPAPPPEPAPVRVHPAPAPAAPPPQEEQPPPHQEHVGGTESLIMLVMGCASGSGQSTIARALAAVLAQHQACAVVTFAAAEQDHPALDPAPHTADTAPGAGEGPVPVILTAPEGPLRAADCAALLAPVLERYPRVVIDPPPGTITPLLAMADHLVLTSTNTMHGARTGLLSTEWLRSAGHEVLCEQAQLVLTPASPHAQEPVLNAATVGLARVHTPAWDEHLRTTGAPRSCLPTFQSLAEQATTVFAHP